MNTIRSVFPLREIKFDAPAGGVIARTFSGYGAAFNNIDAYGDVISQERFLNSWQTPKAVKRRGRRCSVSTAEWQ